MTIQNWGAMSDIVAAVAVLITLIYLAVQIRQNTKTMRATSTREILFKLSDWHLQQVTNPQMMRKFKKSLKPEMPEFSNEQWSEMNSYCKTVFHIFEAQYVQSRFDIGTGDALEPHLKAAKTLVATLPVWRKFWEEETATGNWTKGFVEAINQIESGSFPFIDSDGSEEPKPANG